MEVLSPKSANLPVRQREMMKKSTKDTQSKPTEKPVNPDKIDDKWRPPSSILEPGSKAEIYVTGKKLGKGGFAVCFEGRTKSTGELFALKVVKAQIQQKKMLEKFRTEMQIHAKMGHPNIVEFMRAFTLDGYTYVVLEICNNGSLADMVRSRSCLSLPEVRRYMIQICGGVKYIHKRNVIHRDLKMGNVFIDSQMNLKIGDFGLAAVMADDQDRRTTLCGTPNYIAPEILNKSGTRGHDCKVDTWAVGVICYAMLTGKPPFQSATQQEIYTKLKSLEYEWKVDTINYIPLEAKDCVASCLNLVAADRPDMDELVEQQFFKSGAIAEVLDPSCLKTAPTWLLNLDPRGDRVQPSYGVDHGVICAECGVGKLLDGRFRPAVGTNAKLSALVEIELENRQGTAPVTPLPEGVLYQQFQNAQAEWSMVQKHPLSALPRSRKPVDEGRSTEFAKLKEDIDLDGALTGRTLPPPATQSTRPLQSFAAQQRQQALPRGAISRSVTNLPEQAVTVVEDQPPTSQGLLKARPVRAKTIRSTRSNVDREPTIPKANTSNEKLDAFSERLLRETAQADTNVVAGSLATVPTRTRSTRSQTNDTTRTRAIARKIGGDVLDKVFQPASGNPTGQQIPSKRPVPSFEELENLNSDVPDEFGIPKFKTDFRPRLIEDSEAYTLVPDSSYAKIMQSLQDLHGSLGQVTSSRHHQNGNSTKVGCPQYPRVDKWVDYATKHGIAYILTDGSLGMILKSKETDHTASSCIVVRNARRHTILRARGVEQQLVPQGSGRAGVEFYEQTDAVFASKRYDVPSSLFKLDLEAHSSQNSAAMSLLNSLKASEAQRVKEVCLLDKFGKYMNKQMGASDLAEPEQSTGRQKSHFIHFYQRMGNVGVWRFADGGLQFNFPDHTKIVMYKSEDVIHSDDSNGVMIDLIYLEPSDAKALAAEHVLTNDALERRGILTLSLQNIKTNDLRRSEMEIVRTNQVREKLDWIRAVIGLWIKEGGLGWTGDEKLGWSGMREERSDKKTRLQWVTVGRPGGDEPLTSSQ